MTEIIFGSIMVVLLTSFCTWAIFETGFNYGYTAAIKQFKTISGVATFNISAREISPEVKK